MYREMLFIISRVGYTQLWLVVQSTCARVCKNGVKRNVETARQRNMRISLSLSPAIVMMMNRHSREVRDMSLSRPRKCSHQSVVAVDLLSSSSSSFNGFFVVFFMSRCTFHNPTNACVHASDVVVSFSEALLIS